MEVVAKDTSESQDTKIITTKIQNQLEEGDSKSVIITNCLSQWYGQTKPLEFTHLKIPSISYKHTFTHLLSKVYFETRDNTLAYHL